MASTPAPIGLFVFSLVCDVISRSVVYVHGGAVAEEPTAEFIERPSPLRRLVVH